MAVIFFEGWDLHRRTSTSGIHPLGILDWDGNPNWDHAGGGTAVGWDYFPGYLGGQSFRWFRFGNPIRVDFAENTEIRASFFARAGTKNSGTGAIYAFKHAGTGNNRYVAIRNVGLSAQGEIVADIGVLNGSTDFTGSNVSSGNFIIDDDWAHYDVYLNSITGEVQVRKNKELVLSETVSMLDTAGFARFSIYGGVSNLYYDHLVMTDGESLIDTNGFHAIAVNWAMSHLDVNASGAAMRGRISKGEETFFGTEFDSSSALDWRAPFGAHVYHAYWAENPFTEEPWGTSIDIDSWGLCRTRDGGGWLAVPAANLAYVVMTTDGYPLIKHKEPEEAILIDEHWVRTDPSMGWHEHVKNIPRELPPWDLLLVPLSSSTGGPNPFDQTNRADWSAFEYDELWNEHYIGATRPGCITFSFGALEPPTTFGGTGLAFAEEYRVNYRDWQSIIEDGVDFCSYFITGYKIHGEGNKKFQSNYLTVNFETDVLGSAYIQGVWDYSLGNKLGEANSRSDTGRWGMTQQVYGPRNSADYKHAFSKLKIRGHGKALQLKVKCETGKPFYINGWAMFVTGNSTT